MACGLAEAVGPPAGLQQLDVGQIDSIASAQPVRPTMDTDGMVRSLMFTPRFTAPMPGRNSRRNTVTFGS